MVTPKQIAEKTMTEEKRKSAKNDLFAYYVGRPISYVLTVPFLAVGMKPNTISFLSLFPSFVGFFLLGFGQTRNLQVIGVLCFLLWNFMDGIDGNTARYTGQTSDLGTLWDAASGYNAGMLMHFAAGISIMNREGGILRNIDIPDYYYIVLSGLTVIMMLFSRLVMHKKMVLFSSEAGDKLRDKSNFNFPKLVVHNLTSGAGFVQVLLLLAVFFNWCKLFVVFYFLLHFVITVYSMRLLLKE